MQDWIGLVASLATVLAAIATAFGFLRSEFKDLEARVRHIEGEFKFLNRLVEATKRKPQEDATRSLGRRR